MKILILMLLSVSFFITACDGGDSAGVSDDGIYAVGDKGPSGVGIVFYVTDGGLHGLEASPVDISKDAIWSTVTNVYATGSSTECLPSDLGTGSANTDTIIAQINGADCAAKKCRDYKGGGKTDWYLPSKEEAAVMFTHKDIIGMSVAWYWTSSENNIQYVGGTSKAVLNLFKGDTNYSQPESKTDKHFVRAIRSF